MAETREILFKFTASEVELQKSLEKVSQQLVDAREDLKTLNQSFRAAQNVISGYDESLGQLNLQLEKNEISTQEYDDSVQELNNELKTAENITESYAREQARLKGEISELNKEQNQYIRDLRNLERVTESAEGSNDQLRASIALLNREYNALSQEQRENTQRGRELTKALAEQREALRESRAEIGDNTLNVGNYTSAFSGLTGGITETIGSLVGPGGLVAGITIAADLIGDGIEAVQEITKEFVTFRGEVQRLTGETGESLDDLTTRLVNISRVFEQDFNEVLIASNALARQLGITQQEAAELIETGFLTGANASGELLDILREYPAQLFQVGVSADQAIALITQQVQEGVFSDKGIDAIKEAGERISLFEENTQQALAALGIENIEGIPIFDVIRQASEEISKLPEGSQEATEAIEAIFGTPGLDAGFRYISVLKDAQESVQDLVDDTNPLINLQLRQLEVGQRLADAQNELSKAFEGTTGELDLLIDEATIFLIEVLLELIDRLEPAISLIKGLINVLGILGDAFASVNQFISDTLVSIGLLEEGTSAFGSVVDVIVDGIINGFGFGIFDAIGRGIRQLQRFIGFLETIPARLSNVFENIQEFSNEFLGTDFEISPQIEIDTSEAEQQIDAFQVKLDELGALPVPVELDIDEQNARREAAAAQNVITEEQEKGQEKRKREREQLNRQLKILDQERLRDQIAGIQLALQEVAKGSTEELALRRQLLEKEEDLILSSKNLTANQELLLNREFQEKETEAVKIFRANQAEFQLIGLESIRKNLNDRLNSELEANEIISTSANETEANKLLLNDETTQAVIDNAAKRSFAESVAYSQTRDFAEETLRDQIKFLQDLLKSEELTAAQRQEIQAQLGSAQRQIAAETLSAITQLTGAFTTFFQSQKEKELAAAQGNAEKEAEINEKFARREQRVAIFESIINTGVAVVKALPNIPLSILVGTLGAVQTAAIANQSFASGGFTGGGLFNDPNEPGRNIAGVVHDNEYVIPSSVLGRPEGMKLAMASERLRKGFVDGGFTSGIPTFSDGGINLSNANEAASVEALAKAFKEAVNELPTPVVDVSEVTRTQRRIEAKETTSSL